MTSAGVGVAVHLDGFTAAGLAAHRALAAAGPDAAVEIAMVFAGTRHDDDEYSGVLSAVRRTIPKTAAQMPLPRAPPVGERPACPLTTLLLLRLTGATTAGACGGCGGRAEPLTPSAVDGLSGP